MWHAYLKHHIVLFVVAFAVYLAMGFEEHFENVHGGRMDWSDVLLYTSATHTTMGDNSIRPITSFGKCITFLHTMIGWYFALLFVSSSVN